MERSTVQSCLAAPFRLQKMNVDRHSRGTERPRFARDRSPPPLKRAQGRPGADGHPRSAARKCSAEKPHSSIQVTPNTRPSLRDGLTAYAVLSPETNSCCLRHFAKDDAPRPVGAMRLRGSLAVATTARTTRFCRTHRRRSYDTACDELTGVGSILCPPCPHIRAGAAASTASPAHVRDDVRSPLSNGPGWRENAAIQNFGKVEYFCEGGLTGIWRELGVLPDGSDWRRARELKSWHRPMCIRSLIALSCTSWALQQRCLFCGPPEAMIFALRGHSTNN